MILRTQSNAKPLYCNTLDSPCLTFALLCFQEIIGKDKRLYSLLVNFKSVYHSIYWPQEMPQIDIGILR